MKEDIYQTPVLTIGSEFNNSIVKKIVNIKHVGVVIHTEDRKKYTQEEIENLLFNR